jgi:hypothetical protein
LIAAGTSNHSHSFVSYQEYLALFIFCIAIMKFSTGRLAVGLAAVVGCVQAFPTPENLAKLALEDGLSPEQLHEQLSQLKERSLLFGSLDKPISGDSLLCPINKM